jgi:O-antigen/teichoic acid export membrane protein
MIDSRTRTFQRFRISASVLWLGLVQAMTALGVWAAASGGQMLRGFALGSITLSMLTALALSFEAGLTVISGLDGGGRPGLGSIARLASTGVTIAALLILLPRFGIIGAAAASLIGYGIFFAASLMFFAREQSVGVWELLRPRREDISYEKIKSLIGFSFMRRAGEKV